MKICSFVFLLSALLPVWAEDGPVPGKYHEESNKVANDQDELSADVQQLVIEQTVPEVIKLLDEVQDLMDEVTDSLAKGNTGGDTMAAQTVIIEKINQAAQKRQEKQGGGEAGSAMLDMMQRMMGKEPGQTPAEMPDKGGPTSKNGASETANDASSGTSSDQETEQRRVPKATGSAGSAMPPEFQKAMDAYNRGMEEKQK